MATDHATVPSVDEFILASSTVGENLYGIVLCIPDMKCGSCIGRIERNLGAVEAVQQVRANLTRKQVSIQWMGEYSPQAILNSIAGLGFAATLLDTPKPEKDAGIKSNIRALAVSGFAASNVMLLSVAVWSGADESTRQLFHWVSAAIAIPAVAYSGQLFFRSAWSAVRVGRTNMDVPVSIGIVLAVLLGLYDTINHAERVYFEAVIMLVFVLLIGRTLDNLMRARASNAADGLRAMEPSGAYVVTESGKLEYRATVQLSIGDKVRVKTGERVPVDGIVYSGQSYVDTSIVDGESTPKKCKPGQQVYGGTLNVSTEFFVRVTASADKSFLAQMHNLVQFAHSSKSVYTQISDKVSRWYAPVVHAAALVAFVLWMYLTGDVHKAITVAISVLIITCPCALALAVPMVHVIAGSQLLRHGIIMKNGSALEKLGSVGTVVFDKTGTLTVVDTQSLSLDTTHSEQHLKLARSLSQSSEHPFAKVLMTTSGNDAMQSDLFKCKVRDVPACGLEAIIDGETIRLGRRSWAADNDSTEANLSPGNESESVLTSNGRILTTFKFSNPIRKGAVAAVARLKSKALNVIMISGDQLGPVAEVARQLQISDARSGALPEHKVSMVQDLSNTMPVLMVGDGINDTGAMAAAHVAMAPGTAASVGRNMADFIFIKQDMNAVPDAIGIAQKAKSLVKQNIVLAIGYNMLVLPLAYAGLVTPLIAAVAMSLSSIIVVANSMRLSQQYRLWYKQDDLVPAMEAAEL